MDTREDSGSGNREEAKARSDPGSLRCRWEVGGRYRRFWRTTWRRWTARPSRPVVRQMAGGQRQEALSGLGLRASLPDVGLPCSARSHPGRAAVSAGTWKFSSQPWPTAASHSTGYPRPTVTRCRALRRPAEPNVALVRLGRTRPSRLSASWCPITGSSSPQADAGVHRRQAKAPCSRPYRPIRPVHSAAACRTLHVTVAQPDYRPQGDRRIRACPISDDGMMDLQYLQHLPW